MTGSLLFHRQQAIENEKHRRWSIFAFLLQPSSSLTPPDDSQSCPATADRLDKRTACVDGTASTGQRQRDIDVRRLHQGAISIYLPPADRKYVDHAAIIPLDKLRPTTRDPPGHYTAKRRQASRRDQLTTRITSAEWGPNHFCRKTYLWWIATGV